LNECSATAVVLLALWPLYFARAMPIETGAGVKALIYNFKKKVSP
jgi:hypothetical protein